MLIQLNRLSFPVFLFLVNSISVNVFATEKAPLPEPLTFQQAIDYFETQSNFLKNKQLAKINIARSNTLSTQSTNDFNVEIKGYLRKVGVSDVGNPELDNDSKISLFIKKPIYNFGVSADKESIAASQEAIQKQTSAIEYSKQKTSLVEAYYSVLRADNEYLTHNEAMSLGFVRFNRRQQYQEFGITSDLEILEAQTNYELIRQKRYLSEKKQRSSRQLLAEILGSGQFIPDLLEVPKYDRSKKIIDDVDAIIDLAIKYDPVIKQKHLIIFQNKQKVQLSSREFRPSLDAELEVSNYERDSGFRDDWRASLYFNIPLYQGSKIKIEEGKARAELMLANADLDEALSEQRLKILKLWQFIQQKTVELEGAIIQQEYRDLYLDKSRADYELEFESDLGDAMVEFSKSRQLRYDIQFDLEIAWFKLAQILGENKLSLIIKPKQNS